MTTLPDIGLAWPDRRPLVQLILADPANVRAQSSETGAIYDGSATDGTSAYQNVNGWNNQGPNSPAFGTGTGAAANLARLGAFQAAVLASVSASVANAQALRAQGVIVWDITGAGQNSFMSGMLYAGTLGDPRFLAPSATGLTGASGQPYPYVDPGSALAASGCAPETNAVADQAFAMILAAGLTPGICLRAEKVPLDATNAYFKGNASGSRQNAYGALSDQLADMDAKVTYAYARWGCRIFYVDNNACSADAAGALSAAGNGAYALASVYQQLRVRHPDCLFMPSGYYSNGIALGGYNEPNYLYQRSAPRYTELVGGVGTPFLAAGELTAVPSAFTVVNLKGLGPTDATYLAPVTAALRAGQCVLLAPYTAAGNEQQLAIYYQQAARVNGF